LIQVTVHAGNVDQALRALKKRMQREGVFRCIKNKKHYEKPSLKKKRKEEESERRRRKLDRKRYIGE